MNTPLSAAGEFNIYNDAGDVDIIADVNGYYADHDHDDRYEVLPTRLTIAPGSFEPTTITGTWQQTRQGTLSHSGAPEPVCARAPIEIPAGHDVTGAEVVYLAFDENDETTLEIVGVVATAGTFRFDTFQEQVAGFEGVLDATPIGGAGAAPGNQIIESQALTVPGGSASIDDDRIYNAQVCTADQLEIYAFHIDIAPTA